VPTAHVTFTGVIEHTVPSSFFDAAAKNEVLQIVVFAIIFAAALARVPAEPLVSLEQVLDADRRARAAAAGAEAAAA
jgi:Na+/H+-dicarboxylate symporter